MYRKTLLAIVLLSTTLHLTAQKKTERKGDPTEQLENVMYAKQVAQYGYANADALSLLTAAKILIANPTTDLVSEKKESGTTVKEERKEDNVDVELDIEKLIADAKVIAKENENVLALAATIEDSIPFTTRDAVGGPKIVRERVNSNDYDIYNVRFYGGVLAEVALSGDGDTDLDLYIYDDSGNVIESDTDYSDNCYVSWYPKWTGTFRIKVKNLGIVYNNYTLATN